MSLDNICDIVSSQYQTKTWRIQQPWYKTGKCNECEKYQLSVIAKYIDMPIKTLDRLNYETKEIKNICNPLSFDDGFEWRETFDGKITYDNKTVYFNLKFVCGQGGSQNRPLREVYHFIKNQYIFCMNNFDTKYIFVNILDGDECFRHMSKFNHIKELYKHIKTLTYILQI